MVAAQRRAGRGGGGSARVETDGEGWLGAQPPAQHSSLETLPWPFLHLVLRNVTLQAPNH